MDAPVQIDWLMEEAPQLASGGEDRSFLSDQELEQLAGMRFPKRRQEWLLGRLAAKRLLCAVFGEPDPTRLTVANLPSGAPIVRGDNGVELPLSLSISHRAPRAAVALAQRPGAPLGIDLERVEPRHPAFLSDYLTQDEQAWVARGLAGTADEGVTLAWSAKEAVMKALRTGLRLDPRRIAIQLQAGGGLPMGQGGCFVASVQGMGTAAHGWWCVRAADVLTIAYGAESEVTLNELSLRPAHSQ